LITLLSGAATSPRTFGQYVCVSASEEPSRDSRLVSQFTGETEIREFLSAGPRADPSGWTLNVLLWYRASGGSGCYLADWRHVQAMEAPLPELTNSPRRMTADSIVAFHDGSTWYLALDGDVFVGPEGWSDSADPGGTWADFRERIQLPALSATEMRAAMIRDAFRQVAATTVYGHRIEVALLPTDRLPSDADLKNAAGLP